MSTRYTGHARRRGERGATLIMFALSLVALCAVIALVIGGSLGYSAERNSQTASDAAALAATSVLRDVQTKGISSSEVVLTAQEVAAANGHNGASLSCDLITNTGNVIAPCGSATALQFTAASGVRVDTSDSRDVPFGEVAGNEKITGATSAAAAIQPVLTGTSPFMVCAPAAGHPKNPLTEVAPDVWQIDDTAIGYYFVLQGTPMKDEGRDCANPASNWRGWIDFDGSYQLNDYWEIENGNKNGHISRQLVQNDACGGDAVETKDFIGCTLMVPLCTAGDNGGGHFRVYCVKFGAFEIMWNGSGPSDSLPPDPSGGTVCSTSNSQHICGKFIGAAVATEGQGSNEQAGTDDVVVIKLVE